MVKKLILIFALSIFVAPVWAVEVKDLNPEFFSRFNDENLVNYINQAIENNHSAKQATYRVEEYRQQVKYTFSRELPSFSVSANYLGIHVPELDTFSLSKSAFVLPFFANYEADLLLKNHDRTKSQKKLYEISKFDEKSAYLALLSDVATVYTNILQYDELVKLAQTQVEVDTQILSANTKKFNRGVINSTQYNNSKKNLEASKNELENFIKERDVLLMQLAVLTGVSPTDTSSLTRGTLDNFEYNTKIPSSVDSDVIFARPDVMAAEAQLEKAKIDIRIARKDFLPTFNITGMWTFNTLAPGTFFSWESSLAQLLAGATQDIFTGGRKIANLKIQKAKYEELFESYRETDLEAVKEVNTALCFTKHDSEVDKNTIERLNYETKNFESAHKKLNQGTISKPDYLNEQSNLIRLQREAANSKTQRLVNYYTLYKAVGGKI